MTDTTLPPARAALGDPERTLRLVLGLDVLVTGANGAAYLVLADVIATPLGLEPGLLRGLGAFLVVFAGAVWLVRARRPVPAAAVRAVAAANVGWATGSFVVLAAGWLDPSTLGGVWTVLQAGVVAGFAALQGAALRRRRWPAGRRARRR